MELAYVDVPEEFAGTVIQKLSQRKGELQGMGTGNGRLHPSGVLDPVQRSHRLPRRVYDRYKGKWYHEHQFSTDYGPYKGDLQYRKPGISDRV